MVDRPLRSTEINPRMGPLSSPEEDKTHTSSPLSRKAALLNQAPSASLFCSIVRADLEGTGSRRRIQADMLSLFPGVASEWEAILPTLLQGKTNRKLLMKESFKPNVPSCYGKICSLFAELVMRFKKEPENEQYSQHTFAEEFVLAAILGIEHTHRLLALEVFDKVPAGPDLNVSAIESHFSVLKTFNEFFFVVAKLKCNVMLQERHLSALQRVISDFFKLLKDKLNNAPATFLGAEQTKKRETLARFAYYVLQTVAAMAVFGEAPALSKKKYPYILDRFQTTFALIASSRAVEAVFAQLLEFEEDWQTLDGTKCTLSSFNQKRLSIYVLPSKLVSAVGDIPRIRISLKYVVTYYNYKILKVVSERVRLNHDERLLAAFSPLIQKNKELLSSMLNSKETPAPMETMLLLNENMAIIKAHIVSLAHFSEKLDRVHSQPIYALIRETSVDSLRLAIRANMHVPASSREEIDSLTIFSPADMLALVFKSLLLFRVRRAATSFKYEQEMAGHVNMLIADMTSVFIHTESSVCTYLYRLYFLQFVNAWDARELKERHAKYVEDMARILSDSQSSHEGELVDYLKDKVFDTALSIYVKLSAVECTMPIELTLRAIAESATNERQLMRLFYVLECLLCKTKIQAEDYDRAQRGDPATLEELFGRIVVSKETELFVHKNGIGTLLGIYRNSLQCLTQRLRMQSESDSAETARHSSSPDVNKYVTQTVAKETDSAIRSYRNIVEQTGAFILATNAIVPIVRHCLVGTVLEHEFYSAAMQAVEGRKFLLRLLEIFGTSILRNMQEPELVERYVAMLTDTLAHLWESGIPAESEKETFLGLVRLLQALASEKNGPVTAVAREMLFRRAMLQLLLEQCRRPRFEADVEVFAIFLGLTKDIVKDNKYFRENVDCKASIYQFIQERFCSLLEQNLLSLQRIEDIFLVLLAICYEKEINILVPDTICLIKETDSLETYYGLLLYCFRTRRERSNRALLPYILHPLETAARSLCNESLISRILIKLGRYIGVNDIQKHLSSHVGRISSTHTASRQMCYLMKLMRRNRHQFDPAYFQGLIDTLVDMILGESITSFYFFDGSEQAFIRLKTPIVGAAKGYYFTGNIQLERDELKSRQCIFSLLRLSKAPTGIELYTENGSLMYRTLRGSADSFISIPKLELKEHTWHSLTVSHFDRELVVKIDEFSYRTDCLSITVLGQTFDCATIGAAIDPGSMKPQHHLLGEMSTLTFYGSPPVQKPVTSGEGSAAGSFVDTTLRDQKRQGETFAVPPFLVVNPKFHAFRIGGKDATMFDIRMNTVENIQNTQVFYNRPAKDVLFNFGGFRTCVLVLSTRLTYQSQVADDLRLCTGLMRLLYALCFNNDAQTVDYCLEEGGLDVLKHIFEKVANSGTRFTMEFAESIFNIVELPTLNGSAQLKQLVPELLRKLVFNLYIWTNSDHVVQKYIIDRAENLFERVNSISFVEGEPYRAILGMLFAYYSPELVEIEESKQFLKEIRNKLMRILVLYLEKKGTPSDVDVLTEYLCEDMEKCYSVRDLLFVIMVYVCPTQTQTERPQNVFIGHLIQCHQRKEQECDFLVRMFALLRLAVSAKKELLGCARPAVGPRLDCMEEIVAYGLHILLSFNWEYIYSVKSGSQHTSPTHSGANNNNKLTRIIQCLKPKKSSRNFQQTEEVILFFVLSSDDVSKYLGRKTYLSLLSQTLLQPSIFYEDEGMVCGRVMEMQESDVSVPRFRLFYREIMSNLNSFQFTVQERVLADAQKFIANPVFMGYLLSLDEAFEAISGMLLGPEYFGNTVFKRSMEDLMLVFLRSYLKDRQKRDFMQRALRNIAALPTDVLLELCNKIVTYLLSDPLSLLTEEVVFNVTQLVYLIEDVALQMGSRIGEPMFIELVARVVLYLNEIRMLYFWYPPIAPSTFAKDCAQDAEATYTQREGGMVRVFLKIIPAIILQVDEKENAFYCELSLKLLKFFLFHKRSTHIKIAKALEADSLLPSLKEMVLGPDEGFVHPEFRDDKEQIHERSIAQEKGVMQRTVDELFRTKKSFFNSPHFRLMHCLTQVGQLLVYLTFGVTQYQDIDPEMHQTQIENVKITYKTSVLAKLLAKLLGGLTSFGEKSLKKVLSDLSASSTNTKGTRPTAGDCLSSLDFALSAGRRGKRLSKEFSGTGGKYLTGSPSHSKKSSHRHSSDHGRHRGARSPFDLAESYLTQMQRCYGDYVAQKIKKSDCVLQVQATVLRDEFIDVMLLLHRLTTEDLVFVDEALQTRLSRLTYERRDTEFMRELQQGYWNFDMTFCGRKREAVESVQKVIDVYRGSNALLLKAEETSRDADERISIRLIRMQKSILMEEAFQGSNREAKTVYRQVSECYGKLLRRCPLYRATRLRYKHLQSPQQTFVQLELATDNLGRCMRLRELDDPLSNRSVLGGIGYMRHFFLKRLILRRLLPALERIQPVPDRHAKLILMALFRNARPKLAEPSFLQKGPAIARFDEGQFRAPDLYGSAVSFIGKSRLLVAAEARVRRSEAAFEVEIIKLDHSFFGDLEVAEDSLTFSSKPKDQRIAEYRLGPTSEVSVRPNSDKRKRWFYSDIERIIMRRYNLIRQAVEIFLTNKKSVLLVLFSKDRVHTFFSRVRKTIGAGRRPRYPIEFLDESKIDLCVKLCCEQWRRKHISSFDYLMRLNFYAARSFRDLSQYPIFPWVISNYSSPSLALNVGQNYRDLSRPAAAISDKKAREGDTKYDNTDDFPDGRFQFGTHYMPGRVVLSYLTRVQPYTIMSDRFDSEGELPARQFHVLETLWNSICNQCDTNYELVPEFFYNPEVFVNHNKYSFGTKVMEKNSVGCAGLKVRVDGLLLPPWALNNHHFVYTNFMALERDRVREQLGHWIDLIFGVHQQDPARHNLFKPLTAEAVVRGKLLANSLYPADLHHISEFGHNPMQLFEKEHDAFDPRAAELVYDPVNPLFVTASLRYFTDRQTDKSVGIIPILSPSGKALHSTVTSSNLLSRKQYVLAQIPPNRMPPTKGKVTTLGKPEPLLSSFSIYDEAKAKFNADPSSVYSVCGPYLAVSRDLDNRFAVYRDPAVEESETEWEEDENAVVSFHKNIVTAIHVDAERIYTGDLDGVVAVWSLHSVLISHRLFLAPLFSFNDHPSAVVSLATSHGLDLYASASAGNVCLRVESTNRFFRTVVPGLSLGVKYNIFKVVLSARGYLVVQARTAFSTYEEDMLIVYSINGEKVAEQKLDEFVNAMLFDPTEYYLITGGSRRVLKQFCIITLREENLNKLNAIEPFPATVVSVAFMSAGSTMLVGLANSQLATLELRRNADE